MSRCQTGDKQGGRQADSARPGAQDAPVAIFRGYPMGFYALSRPGQRTGMKLSVTLPCGDPFLYVAHMCPVGFPGRFQSARLNGFTEPDNIVPGENGLLE